MDLSIPNRKHIVITGSTRGLGFCLADAFLAFDCLVTVSGRAQASVDEAVYKLAQKHASDRVHGYPCDVRRPEQVQALWQAAKVRFGKVDIWINNAGYSAPQMSLQELPPSEAQAVIETNLLGTVYGARVAMSGMLEQGFGGIYNMEGLGSDGRKQAGLALYGTSKYSLRYFTGCLVNETSGTPLVIGALSPGMVITEMITGQFQYRPEEWERFKRVLNLLAERPETVAPWLVQRILANRKSGVRIAWLTKRRLLRRILSAPFKRRNLFE